MKKSQLITLVLMSSLTVVGCSKKEKKQPDEWSVQTDTENKGEIQNYQSGSHVNPFFWYWMMSRGGSGYGYYQGRNYSNFRSSSRQFGSHSFTGGRSVISRATSISRGGFGSTGRSFGVSS
ncbi:MAG: hypothetical protein ACM3RX_02870 [Methanococcaceae archaeon]